MTRRDFRAYMICTTPRSGSTLLCRMLASTGVAGAPDSHFHAPTLAGWLDDHDLDQTCFASEHNALRSAFKAAMARGKGDTDIFGLRMQRASFAFFLQKLEQLIPGPRRDADRIEAAFGPTLYVHLSRSSDRLGQAISRLRAEQTGLWHRSADGTELERLAPHRDARYDATAISRHMAELAALDDAWTRWFEQEAIQPLRVSYDDLSQDPRTAVARILVAMGLDPGAVRDVAPSTARLADPSSCDWRRRFESEA